MQNEIRPLIEVLSEVPDPRTRRGCRYSLASILTLVCLATLCGYKSYGAMAQGSYGAMAQWIEDYGSEWLPRLGFTRGVAPSVGTLHAILKRLDVEKLEQILGHWAQSVLLATGVSAGVSCAEVIAIDGKNLRSAAKQGAPGAPGAHLLSALAPVLGLTLHQKAVPAKTNEIGAVQEVLAALALKGRIVTVDALLTQREVARTIVEKGGTT